MEQKHLIFLSYSTPDRAEVLAYYDRLDTHGYNVWMDRHKLIGGQNWDLEIKRALQKAAIIVVFLSHNSVDRRGYAHKEIKIALEQAEARLIDDIYLIPVLLNDDVAVPEQLTQIQTIGSSFEALTEAIDHQLEKLGAESSKAQADANVRWSFTSHEDSMEALPGYDTRFRLIHLSSREYKKINEITDIIRGELQREATEARKVLFEQNADLHNFGEEKYLRQNSWEADCGDPYIQGRILSLSYSIYWYFAGAAHPNSSFRTFNFALNPLVAFSSAQELFEDEEEALAFIQKSCREKLLGASFDEMIEEEKLHLDRDWVNEGTASWEHFQHFTFSNSGMEFLFPPYQVGAYAFGPHRAVISYDDVAPFFKEEIACLLGVKYLRSGGVRWPTKSEVTEEKDAPANDEGAA